MSWALVEFSFWTWLIHFLNNNTPCHGKAFKPWWFHFNNPVMAPTEFNGTYCQIIIGLSTGVHCPFAFLYTQAWASNAVDGILAILMVFWFLVTVMELMEENNWNKESLKRAGWILWNVTYVEWKLGFKFETVCFNYSVF